MATSSNASQVAYLDGNGAGPDLQRGPWCARRRHAEGRGRSGRVDENFDWSWAPLLYSGADLWLNTPKRPYEASGTSGMKAALNGVPSLSELDGWWVEGCLGWPCSLGIANPSFQDRPLALAGPVRFLHVRAGSEAQGDGGSSF
jgi:hypothetical protein